MKHLGVFLSILIIGVHVINPLNNKLVAQEKNNISIKGVLNNYNDISEASLLHYSIKTTPVGKANISTDGKFEIIGNIEKVDIYKLTFSKTKFIVLIIEPDEKIKINFDLTNPKDLKIKGSPQSILLFDVDIKAKKYKSTMDSLERLFKQNKTHPNIDSLKTVLISDFKKVTAERDKFLKDIITANTKSLMCLFFIHDLDKKIHLDLYKKVDKDLTAKYPDNRYVKDFSKKFNKKEKNAIGTVAPEISLPDPDGKVISLSSLRGNIVLIDFWAAWCGPCRKENPNVVRLYHKFHDKGFEIFGVSLDKSKTSWVKAIQKDKLTWTHVSDLKYWKSAAAGLYGVNSIPFTVLIDKEGKIIAKNLRGQSLERKLEELFNHK